MSCSPESIAWRCPNEPLATSILLSLATALLIAQGVLAGPNAGFVVSVDEPLRVENPVLSQTVSVVVRATATTEAKGILISAIFDPTVVEFLS